MSEELESCDLVRSLSEKTGVQPGHVVKVLSELGLERFHGQAVAQNSGVEPTLDQAKLMFRLSKNSVVC